VVEVVVSEEQVDLVSAGQQLRRRRTQQPAQAGAGVEDEKQAAFVDREAGGLAFDRGDPALRAERGQPHRDSSQRWCRLLGVCGRNSVHRLYATPYRHSVESWRSCNPY